MRNLNCQKINSFFKKGWGKKDSSLHIEKFTGYLVVKWNKANTSTHFLSNILFNIYYMLDILEIQP